MKRLCGWLLVLVLLCSLTLAAPAAALADRYPSKFSLVDQGLSSPIRDQKDIGSCFIFAITGAIENRLRAQGIKKDLSEWAFYKTYSRYYPEGVYNYPTLDVPVMAGRLAAIGPEKEAPYPQDAKHAYEISSVAEKMMEWMASDIYIFKADRFKEFLSNGYEIVIVVNTDDKYMNGSTIYCYDNAEKAQADHEVTIVGWDDNYSRNKFTHKPKNDGAWLVRNSWGTYCGDSGYYWLSYEDEIIKYSGGAALEIIKGDTYKYLQQYDLYGWNYWFGLQETNASPSNIKLKKAYMANTFTAENSQKVEAVGLYAVAEPLTYKIWVCDSLDSFDPSAKPNGTYTSPNMGYHVIPLDTGYPCAKGQQYCVVAEISSDEYGYLIPIDQGSYYGQRGKTGVSACSILGSTWFDPVKDGMSTAHNRIYGNVCLKAYANPASASNPTAAPKKTGTPRPTQTPKPTATPRATQAPSPTQAASTDAVWLDGSMLRIDYSLFGKTYEEIKPIFPYHLSRPANYFFWADHMTVSTFEIKGLTGMVFYQNKKCVIVTCEETRHFNHAIEEQANSLFTPKGNYTWLVPGKKCQFVLSMETYPILNTKVFRQWYFDNSYDGYRGSGKD